MYLLRSIIIVLIFVTFSSGCSTTGQWAKNSTFTPSWKAIKNAARDSVYDSRTWLPAVGGAIVQIGDFDEQVVTWAAEKNPVFGSRERAQESSDLLRDLSHLNYIATFMSVPSESTKDKLKGLTLGLATIRINNLVSKEIKSSSKRQRPLNKEAYDSFPSKHTSGATVAASLASHNIDHIPIENKKYWQWASFATAGLTGWARIEAGHHYPSDVLYGFALGNLIGSFVSHAFINPEGSSNFNISFYSSDGKDVFLHAQYRW